MRELSKLETGPRKREVKLGEKDTFLNDDRISGGTFPDQTKASVIRGVGRKRTKKWCPSTGLQYEETHRCRNLGWRKIWG